MDVLKALELNRLLTVTCMGGESESISIDELCPTQSHISPRKRLVENPVNLNMGSQWRKPSAAYLRLKENLVLSRCFHRPNMFCGQLWSNVLYLYENSSSTLDTHRTNLPFHFRTQNDRSLMLELYPISVGLVFSR